MTPYGPRASPKWVKNVKIKVFDKNITWDYMWTLYLGLVQEAVLATRTDTGVWIDKYVPRRTGQLQDSLHEWIVEEWTGIPHGEIIRLDVQTLVPYATSISGDPEHLGTWFEHSGKLATAYYYNHMGRIYLDDPYAEQFWYDLMEFFVRGSIEKNLTKAIYGKRRR